MYSIKVHCQFAVLCMSVAHFLFVKRNLGLFFARVPSCNVISDVVEDMTYSTNIDWAEWEMEYFYGKNQVGLRCFGHFGFCRNELQ